MSVAIPTFDTPHARTRLAITVACTSLGFFVVQLDGSILNIALSQIGISLRTGINDLQWTVDAYFVAFAVLLLSAGSLSDRWGHVERLYPGSLFSRLRRSHAASRPTWVHSS